MSAGSIGGPELSTNPNKNVSRLWLAALVAVAGVLAWTQLDFSKSGIGPDQKLAFDSTPMSPDLAINFGNSEDTDFSPIVFPESLTYKDAEISDPRQILSSKDSYNDISESINFSVVKIPERHNPLEFIRSNLEGVKDGSVQKAVKYEFCDDSGYCYHVIFGNKTLGVYDAKEDSGTHNYEGFFMQGYITSSNELSFSMETYNPETKTRHYGMNAELFVQEAINYLNTLGVPTDKVVIYWANDYGYKSENPPSLGYTQMRSALDAGYSLSEAFTRTRGNEVFTNLGYGLVQGQIFDNGGYFEAHLTITGNKSE